MSSKDFIRILSRKCIVGGTEPLARRLDFNIFGDTRRLRNAVAKLAKSLQMSFDRFPDITFRLFQSAAGCDTSWQIGNIRGPVALSLFKKTAYLTLITFSPIPPPFGSTLEYPRERHRPGAPVSSRHSASMGACSDGGFQ